MSHQHKCPHGHQHGSYCSVCKTHNHYAMRSGSSVEDSKNDDFTTGLATVAAVEAIESIIDTSAPDISIPDIPTTDFTGGGDMGGGGASGGW